MCVFRYVACSQELILGKVKEDELVRVKICQSSALRPKRGHTIENKTPDLKYSGALLGPNNNVADINTIENEIIPSSGTSAEAEIARDNLKEVTSNINSSVKEEESITMDSLSEISKFESKSEFCFFTLFLDLSTLRPNCIFIVTVCLVPSPDLSFQPDEHLEVYVSAYENPNHFWIQILGVRSLQLDKLTEEMTRFYSSSNPVRTTFVITSVE